TGAARRSAKCAVATVAMVLTVLTSKDDEGRVSTAPLAVLSQRRRGLRRRLRPNPTSANAHRGRKRRPLGSGLRSWKRAVSLAALDCLLQLAPSGELRHRGRRNRHLLGRVARVYTLPLGAPLRRELPEPRERDFSATPEGVGDGVEEGVNGPRRISAGEARFVGDLVNELLFGQVPLLLSTVRTRAKTLTVGPDPLNHAVLRVFCPSPEVRSHGKSAGAGPERRREPQRRPPRGRPRKRPFGRS